MKAHGKLGCSLRRGWREVDGEGHRAAECGAKVFESLVVPIEHLRATDHLHTRHLQLFFFFLFFFFFAASQSTGRCGVAFAGRISLLSVVLQFGDLIGLSMTRNQQRNTIQVFNNGHLFPCNK